MQHMLKWWIVFDSVITMQRLSASINLHLNWNHFLVTNHDITDFYDDLMQNMCDMC